MTQTTNQQHQKQIKSISHLNFQPEQLLPPLTSYLSCGHLFYRTLHLDESRNALYVGGMDRLIKVNIWILNFNCQSWKSCNLF